MCLPGSVVLHEVSVVQREVVEVREGEDGWGGNAIGCI